MSQASVTLGGVTPPDRDVGHISVTRGREDELDRTGTGNATVRVHVTDERTNYIEGIQTGEEATVNLGGPVGGGGTIFTGYIDSIVPDVHPSQRATYVDFNLVDGTDLLRRVEMAPDPFGTALPRFGYELPRGKAGMIFYEDAGEVQLRINKLLDDANYSGPRAIFTGNVGIQETLYSPRTSILEGIYHAADAEFPGGLANFFFDKHGTARFKGRLARFNPSDPMYDVLEFEAGQTGGKAQVRNLVTSMDRSRLINAFLCTPKGIAEHKIPYQIVYDEDSINQHGLYSDSAEDILTDVGYLSTPNTTKAQECALFALYYVSNYSQPKFRVEQVTFKSLRGDDPRADENWNLLCNVDISHLINLDIGGPGYDASGQYFVEGLSYTIRPGGPDLPVVELSLNLSPTTDYSFFPWA